MLMVRTPRSDPTRPLVTPDGFQPRPGPHARRCMAFSRARSRGRAGSFRVSSNSGRVPCLSCKGHMHSACRAKNVNFNSGLSVLFLRQLCLCLFQALEQGEPLLLLSCFRSGPPQPAPVPAPRGPYPPPPFPHSSIPRSAHSSSIGLCSSSWARRERLGCFRGTCPKGRVQEDFRSKGQYDTILVLFYHYCFFHFPVHLFCQ